MTTLTAEQRQEIDRAGEQPVRVEDPESGTAYYLVRADVYEKLRELVAIDHTDRSLYEFGEFYPDE